MEGEPRRLRLKLTAAALFDYPSASEIAVSFPEEWELVEQIRRGDTSLYVAAMPTSSERPSRNRFHGLGPEINLELTAYRLYKFFLAWPTPSVTVLWDASAGIGRVEGVSDLKVQLQPVGQAQVWLGQNFSVLWECYFHEPRRERNWQNELAAIWRVVEKDMGLAKIFTLPQDPAFEEGYQGFLRRLGYELDPGYVGWWSKLRG